MTAVKKVELGSWSHSFVKSFSVWVGLGKGGQMGFPSLFRGKQALQLYILTSLGIWTPVQIWLPPVGMDCHKDGTLWSMWSVGTSVFSHQAQMIQ